MPNNFLKCQISLPLLPEKDRRKEFTPSLVLLLELDLYIVDSLMGVTLLLIPRNYTTFVRYDNDFLLYKMYFFLKSMHM